MNLDFKCYDEQHKFVVSTKRYVAFIGGRGTGKLLYIHTPIFTTQGWKTIGTLEVGDKVFGLDGNPTTVLFVTPEQYSEKTYKLMFSDGEELIAGKEHLWLTHSRKCRKAEGRWGLRRKDHPKIERKHLLQCRRQHYPVVLSTEDIKNSMNDGKDINHAVHVSSPIVLPEQSLSIHPYLLGVWLGDGSRKGAEITGIDKEIFDNIIELGYLIKPRKDEQRQSLVGNNILFLLKQLNLYGNKHIPEIYKMGSIEQRLSLVQGLMDTDGTVGKDGNCTFDNTNKEIADGMYELLTSLGIKVSRSIRIPKLYGKECTLCYRLWFTTSLPVFKLSRKLKRLQNRPMKRRTQNFRYIVKIEEHPDVPMKCIEVDAPDNLFLVGKAFIPTHNTQSLVYKAIVKALQNPGSFGVITAPSFPMLRDSTKRTFFELCPNELIVYRNDSENKVGLRTSTGEISEIVFKSTSDPDSLRGPSYLWGAMDEAAMEDSKEAFNVLQGTLRALPASEQQIFVCSTPKGMNWVFDEFGPSRMNDADREIIYASTSDNVFLPPEYVQDLRQQYSGAFFEQEFEGKFVAHEGLIYGDLFSPKTHVGEFKFLEQFPIDLAWDFGYPKPEAVLAIQQDARGHVYIIDELYYMRTLTEDIAGIVKAKPWYKNVTDCICDESRPDAITRLSSLGIPARPGNKGKIADGIAKVRSLLAIDPVINGPVLHIDARCEMLLKEFQTWRWMDKKHKDEYDSRPIDTWNHALDAFKGWAMVKWQPPMMVKTDRKPPPRRVMGYQQMYTPFSQRKSFINTKDVFK